MKLKYKLILGGLIALIIAIGARLITVSSSQDIDTQHIRSVMNESLQTSFHSERFVEPAVGFYHADKVNYVVTNPESNLQSISVNDPVIKSAKELHIINLCFMERVTTLQKNSDIYKQYENSSHLTGDYFYTSCPIFVNNKLVGYTEVLIYIKPFGLLPNYNFVLLASHNIAQILQSEL